MKKEWRKYALVAVALVILWTTLRLTTLHYLYYKEVGVTFNLFTGETGLLAQGGWNPLPPWVLMSRIDTKPVRLCIMSSGRGVNCRLVRFEADKYGDFVAAEGFRLYWWSNRISFNLGHDETYRGIKDILRGYAFAAQKYPFITVLEQYSSME